MAIKPNVPYRITVEFKPPLSTKNQFNALCKRLSGEHSALVGLTAQVGVFVILYESLSAREQQAIKPGALIFKIASGTTGPVSSAVIKSIAVETALR